MTIFLFIFALFPTVLNAVLAIEAAAPIAKTGPEKLALVLSIIEQVYQNDPTLQLLLPQAKYALLIEGLVASIVAMLNAVGAFHKSPAPVPAPVPVP